MGGAAVRLAVCEGPAETLSDSFALSLSCFTLFPDFQSVFHLFFCLLAGLYFTHTLTHHKQTHIQYLYLSNHTSAFIGTPENDLQINTHTLFHLVISEAGVHL